MNRCACRQRKRERAFRVVPETELLHSRARLLNEALDRGPVIAAERAVATCGKREHDGAPSTRAQTDLYCLGKDRVGSVRVTSEEAGISEQHQCGASHPASRSKPVERALRVTSQLVDAVPTLKATKNGAPTRQRAAVGKNPLRRSAFRARAFTEERNRRWMFRGNAPALRRGGIADVDVEERAEHRDRGILLDQALVLEPREPTPGRLTASRGVCLLRVQQHEPIDTVYIEARLRVVDRQLRHAVGLVPLRGADVQRLDEIRLATLQLGPQQIAEQVMVPVPLAAAIERDEQKVRVCERFQNCVRARAIEHRIAEPPVYSIEH